MRRLVPEALIGNELIDEHDVCDVLYEDSRSVVDHKGIFERAAKRSRTLDPNGEKAFKLLRRMQLKYQY